MNNPLKISIINRTDTEDFLQLSDLIKKFTIDTYIRNKPEYSQLRGEKNNDLVNKAINEFEGHEDLSILSSRDIEKLKISIQEQIDAAKSLIENGTNGNAETRYYILKDGNNAVAFMQAQISKNKDKNRIEGWRNLAFVEPEYSGKDGETIDTYGNIHKSMYAKAMYDDISQWFEENNVSYERTCTGVNMIHNIQTYVWYDGFLPYHKNGRNIFLEKYLDKKIDKKTLAKVYNLYCKNRDRNKTKNKKSITEEVESTTEFENLSEEQKRGLVDCFLKEEEKEITLPNGEQISIEDYLEKIVEPNIPFAMYKLKTVEGKETENLSSKEFIERFIYSEGQVKHIGDADDIKALLEEKVETIYINDNYVDSQFEEISSEIAKMNKNADNSFIIQGFCSKDLSGIDMSGLSEENFIRLTFDSATIFPENQDLMPQFIKELIKQEECKSFSDYANKLIEQGKDFSNVEQLHADEIDGSETTIAIMDSCFDSSAKEFEGRVVKHIIFEENDNGEIVPNIALDKDNKDIAYSREEYGDDYHGKTTASLAAGKKCGVAPNAEMYLFGVAEGTDWEKAKEAMLKYIKQETENGKMKLPDIISMSADIEDKGEAKKIKEELEKKGCALLDSSRFWENFLWGRTGTDGEVRLDKLMETVSEMPYDKNSKAEDVINHILNATSVVVPCTERTSYSEERRKRRSRI